MLNLNNRDLLARTLEAEAGDQGSGGMLAAGSVIMNRLKNPAYGSELHSVILQPGQFSAWNSYTGYEGGLGGVNMYQITPSSTAYEVADQLLAGTYEDPTGGAMHYYNPNEANPIWGQRSGGKWKKIGDHIFGFPGNKDPNRSENMITEDSDNTEPLNAIPLLGDVNTNQVNAANNRPRRGLFDFLGNAVGGTFSGLKGALSGDDPDKSDRLAIALMSLSGNPTQLTPLMQMAANDIQERKTLKTQNKSIEYLRSVNPELARMAENNPSSISNILSALASAQMKGSGKIMTHTQLQELFPNSTIPEGLYNVLEKDGQIIDAKKVGGGGQTFNLGGKDNPENKLNEELMKRQGISFGKMLDAGSAAGQTMVDLQILQEIAPLQPSGPVTGRLARLFPEANDLAAVRESIVKRIAPALRVEGSGSTSDVEFNAMLNSYGSLLNTPAANAAILSVFQAKAQYNIDRAAIVREYMTSTDPDRLKIANEKLQALDQSSEIKPQVQALLDRYQDTSTPSQQNPRTMTWNPDLNDGRGGFEEDE